MLLRWTLAHFSSFKPAVHFEDYKAMRKSTVGSQEPFTRERGNLSGKAGMEESRGAMFQLQQILLPIYSAIRW